MRYQRFLRKSTYRRYGIFILTIFFSYYSIQAFINNKTIDSSIESVKINNKTIQQEIAFKKNFYENYLNGEYAPYFLGHENGQLYERERLIKIKHRLPEDDPLLPQQEEDTQAGILLETPSAAWKHFFDTRLFQLKKLGILE